jgi:hypothetical protein
MLTIEHKPKVEVLPPEEDVRVVSAAHPLKVEHQTRLVKHGLTIDEIVKTVQPDPFLIQHVYVEIDGWPVPREKWHLIRPKAGHTVNIRIVPMGGGGGGGKNPLRTILMIAVMVAAIALGPALGAAMFGTSIINAGLGIGLTVGQGIALTGAIGTAIIGGIGMLLVNAIAPVKPPKAPSLNGTVSYSDSKTHFIEGSRNQPSLWSAVPVVFGRHRMVPPLGAKSYTEVLGDSQYLRMIVVWGYGPLSISDIKIGETPISEFEDVQISTRQGYDSDGPLTLFTSDVSEQTLSLNVLNASSWINRVGQPQAVEMSIDITFPQGLAQYLDDGSRTSRSVAIEIRYRRVGDSTWLAPNFSAHTVSSSWISVGSNSTTVTVSQATTSAIKHGFRWPVPVSGQYEIEVRRLTGDTDSDRIFDDSYWTAIRTIQPGPPITFPHPLATTELVIRATNQLNSSVDELNGVCTSLLRTWNSGTSEWGSTPTATQNPAAHFLAVLQGPGKFNPLLNEFVDLEGLGDWYEFCEENGYEFNQIRDFQASVWDTLFDIASAGRAAPTLKDGKWSVVIDREQDFPVQHITPRNSSDFKYEKAFIAAPHAWRVRFLNENEGWRTDERIVFADGYNDSNASDYQQLELIGVTNPDQIYKLARHHHAVIRLRPERYSVNMDFEHLVCRRGDLVLLTHDIILVGLAYGRIKEVLTDSNGDVDGLVLDEEITMEAAKNYGISIRNAEQVNITATVFNEPGTTRTITLFPPISSAGTLPEVGDMFGFGLAGLETFECLVYSIERANDLTARVNLIPYSPEIYSAADGPIPQFNTGLTPLSELLAPKNLKVVCNESTLERGEGDVLLIRAVLRVDPVGDPTRRLEVQARPSVTKEPWRAANILRQTQTEVVMGDLRQNEMWDFRARWVVDGRIPGPWAAAFNVPIIGKSDPPAALQNLTLSVFGSMAYLSWDEPTELDVRYGGKIIFRHSTDTTDPSWSQSTFIGQISKTRTTFVVLPLKPGAYLARVFDADGNPSPVVYVTTLNAGILPYAEVELIQEDPEFSGVGDNTVVVDGFLQLDGAGLFDDVADLDTIENVDFLGGVELTGTYYFAQGLDLGTVENVRLTSRVEASSDNYLLLMDSRTDLIDEWENFDGTEQAVATAEVWVRFTNDNPVDEYNFNLASVTIPGNSNFSRASIATRVTGTGSIEVLTTDQPRFHHDPTSWELLGTLVEPSRTNYLTYSQDFGESSDTDWVTSELDVVFDVVSPDALDGTETADFLRESSEDGEHFIYQNVSGSPNQDWSFSVFLKAKERSAARLSILDADNLSNGVYADFDIKNQLHNENVMGNGLDVTASITQYKGGWYRCVVSGKPNTSGSNVRAKINLKNSYSDLVALPIWNSADKGTNVTLSNLDLRATTTSAANKGAVRSTVGIDVVNDARYFEFEIVDIANDGSLGVGIATASAPLEPTTDTGLNRRLYCGDGTKKSDSSFAFGDALSNGDRVAVAVANGSVWFGKVSGGVVTWQNAGDPASNANAAFTGLNGIWYPYIMDNSTGNVLTVDFIVEEADLEGTHPVGFTPGWELDSLAYHGDGARGLYAWGAQLEIGANESTYIPTSATSVTRAVEELNLEVENGTYDIEVTRQSGVSTENNTVISGGSGYDVPTSLSPVTGVDLVSEDPAVWSEWEKLISAEFEARAFEFQLRMSTNDPAFNILVEELRVKAEQLV